MKVKVLEEHGYESASYGFSLSYNTSTKRAKEVMNKLAFKGGGENKFLESIYIWTSVDTARTIWQEADTYRISTKQSESSMHTINKRLLTMDDFEYELPEGMLEIVNRELTKLMNKEIPIEKFKNCLPEGFLQEREWCFNYKTLQNMYNQRKNHRMPQWREFFEQLIPQLEHPEFIIPPEVK